MRRRYIISYRVSISFTELFFSCFVFGLSMRITCSIEKVTKLLLKLQFIMNLFMLAKCFILEKCVLFHSLKLVYPNAHGKVIRNQ